MTGKFRKLVMGVLSTAMVLTLVGATGCTGGDKDTSGDAGDDVQKGGTFAFYISEPPFIDPVNLQDSEGVQVGQAVFDSLVTFDYLTSEIAPAAAESWEPNEDASVWTFHLAKDAKFHNGDPVTAQDFKYAWERICDPKNESEISYHLAPVMGFDEMQDGTGTDFPGVKAIDETTLEVTLNYAFADFEYVVGHPALAPVPKSAVEGGVEYNGATVDYSEMPIGNGPFKMTEPWNHDQYIKVAKFDDYYGDEPNIDGVDFKIFTDQDTAFLEFQAGTVDFTQIPSGQIQSTIDQYGESVDGYSMEPGKQTVLGTELGVYYLLMNNIDDTFKDPKIRQAFSLAINRQAICDTVFEGTRVPATGIVPDGIVGFQDNAWKYSVYDPEEAKTILADAGYPDGKGLPKLKLEYNTGSGHEDILQLVQNDLKAIGVESELVGTEWAQYLDKLDQHTYQAGRLGWQADYPIMDNFLNPLFLSSSSDNYASYKNADVDAKLDEARKTTDADARIALYQEIETIVGDEAACAPLMFYRHTRVASDRVMDGVFSPMSLFNFEKVWLKQDAGGSES